MAAIDPAQSLANSLLTAANQYLPDILGIRKAPDDKGKNNLPASETKGPETSAAKHEVPWYKHPGVLFGAGVALLAVLYVAIRR